MKKSDLEFKSTAFSSGRAEIKEIKNVIGARVHRV
jgi:hypothetical protein